MKKMMISVLGAGLAALFLAGCSGNGNTQTAGSAETSEPEKPASTGAGTYIVSNMEDLLALKPAETKAIVMMKGYYSSGDGGGGTFYYDAAARNQDNGATVIRSDSTKGRFVRDCEENYVNVKWFGAKGDGSTDDTAAIQAAIDALPGGGGTVSLPGGTYNISSAIRIGDGNAGDRTSSKSGIKFIGSGGGFAFATKAATTINAIADMDEMLILRGRISDCEIAGINLAGNGKAKTCLLLHSFAGSYFHNICAMGFTETGIKILGGSAPTGNYNITNRFESLGAYCLYDNTTALLIDGDYASINDTWLTVFTDCRFDTARSKNSVAAHFKFVDSISFYRCHFNTYDDSSTGAIFDALNNNDFPCGMAFYDCSMVSHQVWEDENHRMRKQYFYGFGTYDNEQIPTNSKLIGFTDTGIPFNMDDLAAYLAAQSGGAGGNGEYSLPQRAGRVDTDDANGHGNGTHINLKEGNTVAVLVNAKTQLTGGSFYLSSYGNNTGTVTFDVYRWDTDYKTTLKGRKLATDSAVDFTDNTIFNAAFDGLDTGYYLIVINGTSPADDHGVAVWTRGPVPSSITFVNGERVDAGLRGQFITK